MFTSRAEFRLHLRIDNADERLTPLGRQVGLVDDMRWQQFTRKQEQKAKIVALLEGTRASAIPGTALDNPTLIVWLRRPESRIAQLQNWIASRIGGDPLHGVLTTIETETKYAGYLAQQEKQVRDLQDSENRRIPNGFTYERIPGLSNEVRQKLIRVQPATLGQAGRIPGVTPAAVAVLDIYLTLNHATV
jgi:tRNA uridine 5-carboxymethylaminomethyl modification enzyme